MQPIPATPATSSSPALPASYNAPHLIPNVPNNLRDGKPYIHLINAKLDRIEEIFFRMNLNSSKPETTTKITGNEEEIHRTQNDQNSVNEKVTNNNSTNLNTKENGNFHPLEHQETKNIETCPTSSTALDSTNKIEENLEDISCLFSEHLSDQAVKEVSDKKNDLTIFHSSNTIDQNIASDQSSSFLSSIENINSINEGKESISNESISNPQEENDYEELRRESFFADLEKYDEVFKKNFSDLLEKKLSQEEHSKAYESLKKTYLENFPKDWVKRTFADCQEYLLRKNAETEQRNLEAVKIEANVIKETQNPIVTSYQETVEKNLGDSEIKQERHASVERPPFPQATIPHKIVEKAPKNSLEIMTHTQPLAVNSAKLPFAQPTKNETKITTPASEQLVQQTQPSKKIKVASKTNPIEKNLLKRIWEVILSFLSKVHVKFVNLSAFCWKKMKLPARARKTSSPS